MQNYDILRNLLTQSIEPREFLRYCFGIDKLNPEAILSEEIRFGYSTRCINLISKLLGMQKKTVREWGDNPNFEGMPQHARMTCSYASVALSSGTDIELPSMPKYHQHTLAYALAAYRKKQQQSIAV